MIVTTSVRTKPWDSYSLNAPSLPSRQSSLTERNPLARARSLTFSRSLPASPIPLWSGDTRSAWSTRNSLGEVRKPSGSQVRVVGTPVQDAGGDDPPSVLRDDQPAVLRGVTHHPRRRVNAPAPVREQVLNHLGASVGVESDRSVDVGTGGDHDVASVVSVQNHWSRDLCFLLLDSALRAASILLRTVVTLSAENPWSVISSRTPSGSALPCFTE